MQTLYGKPASEGIAKGRLKVIKHSQKQAVGGTALSAENEIARYQNALQEADTELENLKKRAIETVGEAEASIFEIHRMMMHDDDFTDRVADFIRVKAMCAENAVIQAGEDLAKIFAGMDTEYMRARAADIRSVAARLADILDGGNKLSYELDEPSVIASDDLTPAETICLDKSKVLGVVTELGSDSSHTAILARSMGIPAVVGVKKILPELDGRECIIDGSGGTVTFDPDEGSLERFREMTVRHAEKQRKAETMRGIRLTGRNGKRICICANAAEIGDIDSALRYDAEGIGLFRSEFLFMQYGRSPTEEEQFEAYRCAAEKMEGRECVIRTLDAGADKKIPYLNLDGEHNPALGMRAVRLCLKNPELLHTQFRALYRAASYGNVSAMIPMVVLPAEIDQVRKIAAKAERELIAANISTGKLKLGMMIETPASAVCADVFAGLVDFFSIGTNDLIQYTLAADRENREVSYLADPLPESVKRMIKMTCDAAVSAGIPVSVCGELGGDERYIGFLLDCGVTKLSVSPPNVLRVRNAAMEHLKK